MNKHILLPNKCRLIGGIVFPFALAWLIATYFFEYTVFEFLKIAPVEGVPSGILSDKGQFLLSKGFSGNLNLTFAIVLTLICLFMVAFAKERKEDEYVNSTRLKALQISVYANYIVLAMACLFLYNESFLMVMEVNLFTILVIFIAVYQYSLHIKPRFVKTTDI